MPCNVNEWTRKQRKAGKSRKLAHFQDALKNLSYRFGSALCHVHGRQKEIARKMVCRNRFYRISNPTPATTLKQLMSGQRWPARAQWKPFPVTGEFFQDSRFSRKQAKPKRRSAHSAGIISCSLGKPHLLGTAT